MTEYRPGSPGENGEPIPRDMPDQQAQGGEDPWEVVTPSGDRDEDDGGDAARGDAGAPDPEMPDTDEAGTGRQGAPQPGSPHSEHPVPDESPA
ncbi:hypothetical protein [Streptomyces sp. CRN 30]|uniref:hypothetical protein n=1 Tax=Streptomyces sp. CRN 30 TaxID=3075613 RepID=UPI002A7EB179|nr:hypothetical protein [Streptomyces sp. CRN 30]